MLVRFIVVIVLHISEVIWSSGFVVKWKLDAGDKLK